MDFLVEELDRIVQVRQQLELASSRLDSTDNVVVVVVVVVVV